jgi:hypothetical protein
MKIQNLALLLTKLIQVSGKTAEFHKKQSNLQKNFKKLLQVQKILSFYHLISHKKIFRFKIKIK